MLLKYPFAFIDKLLQLLQHLFKASRKQTLHANALRL